MGYISISVSFASYGNMRFVVYPPTRLKQALQINSLVKKMEKGWRSRDDVLFNTSFEPLLAFQTVNIIVSPYIAESVKQKMRAQ